MKTILYAISLVVVLGSSAAFSIDNEFVFEALGAPAMREVDVAWNRYYDTQGLEQILKELHRAHPEITELYSIGESVQGRPIWCLEVTNKRVGDPTRKAGMYIDGNIHGNEVQAAEVVLYTAWYLCENYGKVDKITELVDERVFYLLPSINPDGRDFWFHEANTPHSSRTGQSPVDNDQDGALDEDGPDDLNGDGSISYMRIPDPNGRWIPHPDYPEYFMVQAPADERGEYSLIWTEGIDNDGDGRINEDDAGGYDPNRNWPYDWQPNYVQFGSHELPASLPETRAVIDFVLQRPNIAGAQSYHNTGGMILRGPGRQGGDMHPGDERMLRFIADRGVRMLPFYRSLVIWDDLYTVWGGEIDWFYGARGIATFTNELWIGQNMFRSGDTGQNALGDFHRYLLMEDALVAWEPYDHPTLGRIEIGGQRKEIGRMPPSFLLEEECHRNTVFTLYHADQMPLLAWGEHTVEALGDDVYRVWIEVRNERLIDSRLQQDVRNDISLPDLVTLSGSNATVLSSGIVTDRYSNQVSPIRVRPERVAVETVPGMGAVLVQFIVQGSGDVAVSVDSVKGGRLDTTLRLEN